MNYPVGGKRRRDCVNFDYLRAVTLAPLTKLTYRLKGHGDTLVVTTHAFIKKSQKTPKNHRKKAVKYKKQYQAAHDKNKIVFVE